VLVAEDDPMLRTLAQHTLQAAGYKLLTAASGTEALRLCEDSAQIALLVTDVMMPGMRGPELIARALRARPSLKVLCTSGYGMADIEGFSELAHRPPFLAKPYLPSALVIAVAEALADEP